MPRVGIHDTPTLADEATNGTSKSTSSLRARIA
jgi:hypothetical protein